MIKFQDYRMRAKLSMLYVFLFASNITIIASNFELYNAQPYPVYYAIQKTMPRSGMPELQKLPAYTYIQLQLDTPTVQFIISKELPEAQKKITVVLCEPQQPATNVYVKTHESRSGKLTVIPQSSNPLHPAQTTGKLELTRCITPYEIWITTSVYTPQQEHIEQGQQSSQIQHQEQATPQEESSITTTASAPASDIKQSISTEQNQPAATNTVATSEQ
jgi:hypothetical protein